MFKLTKRLIHRLSRRKPKPISTDELKVEEQELSSGLSSIEFAKACNIYIISDEDDELQSTLEAHSSSTLSSGRDEHKTVLDLSIFSPPIYSEHVPHKRAYSEPFINIPSEYCNSLTSSSQTCPRLISRAPRPPPLHRPATISTFSKGRFTVCVKSPLSPEESRFSIQRDGVKELSPRSEADSAIII